MAESPDYRELLHAFAEQRVQYLIVGGYAVMKYTEPRYTKDLDVWVSNSPTNARRIFAALARFGAPLYRDGVTPSTFRETHIVYQIGMAPVRIDVSTHVDGLTFRTAWKNRVKGNIFGADVHFLSRGDLIRNKRAAGRRADIGDLERLTQAGKKLKTRRRS